MGAASATAVIRAAGSGEPWIKFHDGRVLDVAFESQDGGARRDLDFAQPVSVTAVDLDEDGMPELIAGYRDGERGSLAIFTGNPDPLYPYTRSALEHMNSGTFSDSPFLALASVIDLDSAPDFIGVGDFNIDGHVDLVTAAIGDNAISWRLGDGRGRLGSPLTTTLNGAVTALLSGEVNRQDGIDDLLVAVDEPEGPVLLVLEGPAGAIKAQAERIDLPAAATQLAIGHLDGFWARDVAALCGDQITIVAGRDRRLSLDSKARAAVPSPSVTDLALATPAIALALGDFVPDEPFSHEIALLTDDGRLEILDGISQEAVSDPKNPPRATSLRWQTVESHDLPAVIDSRAGEPAALLTTARVSSHQPEDLVVVDASQNMLRFVTPGGSELVSWEMSASPSLVLPMRLNRDGIDDLVVFSEDSPIPVITPSQAEATIIVNDLGSGADCLPDDGMCATGPNNMDVCEGPCTLQAAIGHANVTAGADIIGFSVTGTMSVDIIATETLTIDGTPPPPRIAESTFPSPDGPSNPVVSISGHITLSGVSSVMRHVAMHNPTTAIALSLTGNSCLLESSYIGTDTTGTVPLGGGDGIFVTGSSCLIGGPTSPARNIISGNGFTGLAFHGGTMSRAEGNYIGTDPTGGIGSGVGNGGGIWTSQLFTDSTIGGTAVGEQNLISGNIFDGIGLTGNAVGPPTMNMVQGNLIGPDLSGTLDYGNARDGVVLTAGAEGNTVGGTHPDAQNTISGNDRFGVFIANCIDNILQGNHIGLTEDGTLPLGNTSDGIQGNGLNDDGNIIGGTAEGAGNVISANGGIGIVLFTGIDAVIQGNLIGTLADGDTPAGNAGQGIYNGGIPNTQIGGTDSGAGNVIGANVGPGVFFFGTTSSTIEGNFIGTNASGTPLGNGLSGVWIDGGASQNTVGGTSASAKNVIASNSGDGVRVLGDSIQNAIQHNSIHSNTGLGIDLNGDGPTPNDPGDPDAGPNLTQNYPEILSAVVNGSMTSVTMEVELDSTPSTSHTLEFFGTSAGDPEGRTYLGSTTAVTNGSGLWNDTVMFGLPSPQDAFTATATDPDGNTSEFSPALSAASAILKGLEIVQVVQDWAGTAKLAAGKQTIVRAHLENPFGPTSGHYVFRLNGFGPGHVPLNPPSIQNGPKPDRSGEDLTIPFSVDVVSRGEQHQSARFYLPDSWITEGEKTFEFEWPGNPRPNCLDLGTDCTVGGNFITQKQMTVRLLKAVFTPEGGNETAPVTPVVLTQACSEIKRRFPTHAVNCPQEQNLLVYGTASPYPDAYLLWSMVAKKKLIDYGCFPGSCEDFFLAITTFPGCSLTGCDPEDQVEGQAFTGRAAWARDPNSKAAAAAHELGHTLGLQHTTDHDSIPFDGIQEGTCGERAFDWVEYPPDGSEYFPYYVPGLEPFDVPILGPLAPAENVVFGFDTKLDLVVKDIEYALMSYCDQVHAWPDIGSYNVLFDQLTDAGPAPPTPDGPASQYFFVSGLIDLASETAEFDDVFIVLPPVAPPEPPAGDWELIAHFGAGPDEPHPVLVDASPNDPNFAAFSGFVPFDPDINGFTLQLTGMPVQDLSQSANPPTIEITGPAPGTFYSSDNIPLEWTASDPDGDDLTFIVEYSPDAGTTWFTLSFNWSASPFILNSELLEQSSEALFRVTATDGFNSASDTLSGTIKVYPENFLSSGYE